MDCELWVVVTVTYSTLSHEVQIGGAVYLELSAVCLEVGLVPILKPGLSCKLYAIASTGLGHNFDKPFVSPCVLHAVVLEPHNRGSEKL